MLIGGRRRLPGVETAPSALPEVPATEPPAWLRRARGVGLALIAAGLAISVVAFWRGGPPILDRAAAAIAVPAEGQILYENITIQVTPAPYPGSVRAAVPRLPPGALHPPYTFDVRVRVWLTGTAPHRFRLAEDGDMRGRVRGRAATRRLRSAEIGGKLADTQALSYDTISGALVPTTFWSPVKRSDLDVAEFVWQSITAGRAKVDGTTWLHGQQVVRIRIFAKHYGRLMAVGLYFVDGQTYQPVRAVIDLNKHFFNETIPGLPLLSLTRIQASILPSVYGRYVIEFNEWHLAPTAANTKLADIRAAHPTAKIV
jgi:hypothetical protein